MARRRAIRADAGNNSALGHEMLCMAGKRFDSACAMLSTTANPTDGLQFDGDADSIAEGPVHP